MTLDQARATVRSRGGVHHTTRDTVEWHWSARDNSWYSISRDPNNVAQFIVRRQAAGGCNC